MMTSFKICWKHRYSYHPEYHHKDLWITDKEFFDGYIDGKYDKYTLTQCYNSKPTLSFNESIDDILRIYSRLNKLKWNYIDVHNCSAGSFSIRELVLFYRIMMINQYTLIRLDVNNKNTEEKKEANVLEHEKDEEELKLHTIENDPLLSKCLPYHASRHKYLQLCDKLNKAIKNLEYNQIEEILNSKTLITDSKSMKYVFRSLSSCYSFCPLCKIESKNPIQTLLTFRIRQQSTCDKIIEILKLFNQSLKAIHQQRIALSSNDSECRCFDCCKNRCNHKMYITEEREDIVKRKYEILHIQDEIENNCDYLSLCITPHKSTSPKYDIQIIKYLLENNLVSLLPHHFVFAVIYRRKNILKYLFHALSKFIQQDPSLAIIYDQLWLPKQFFFTQTEYVPWLQHPTRISIIGYALQSHSLDPDIIQILLDQELSPNFDDLMALTAICGDKRLTAKRKIIQLIFEL